jgi:hypothetical protein
MKHGSFGPSAGSAAAALVFVAASSGCIPVTPGVLGATGFNQPVYGYHIDYTKPEAQSFLGPDWRVDNFVWNETMGAWKPKDGPNYVAVRELDEDDDGKITSTEKHEEPIYDLRLTNVHDDGVIWVKAHPLAYQDAGRDLDVELNGYADSLSGTGAYYQGSVFAVVHVKSRQFTTFVVDQEKRSVAGLAGLIATVEVAETARLQLEATHRDSKIRVFLSKIRYVHRLPIDANGRPSSTRWTTVPCTKGETDNDCEQLVGLLVVGYVNAASRFDQHIPEYESFLSKVSQGSAPPHPTTGVAAN